MLTLIMENQMEHKMNSNMEMEWKLGRSMSFSNYGPWETGLGVKGLGRDCKGIPGIALALARPLTKQEMHKDELRHRFWEDLLFRATRIEEEAQPKFVANGWTFSTKTQR